MLDSFEGKRVPRFAIFPSVMISFITMVTRTGIGRLNQCNHKVCKSDYKVFNANPFSQMTITHLFESHWT